MTDKKCILTGAVLTKDNDSKAHIIPSALGGNLKPKGIISNEANGVLNDKFDSPLINSLHPFMALLGGIPDRGVVQPTKMRAKGGSYYLVNYGENLKPTRPCFSRSETEEGEIKYEIKARTVKEAKTLIGKIKKEHPDINIDEKTLAEKLIFQEEPVEGMLHQRLNLGPNIFFPASFIMASLFSVANGLSSHPGFTDFVYSFDETTLLSDENISVNKATMPPDTFYWASSDNWFSVDAEISHVLVLFSDPQRQLTLFFVELFNLPGVAVLLPYSGSDENLYSHGINVVTGETANLDIDKKKLKSLKWETTHPWVLGELDGFFKLAQERVSKIIEYSQQRSHRHEIDKKIFEKYGDLGEKFLTEEERKGILEIITASYIKRITHG